MKKDAIWAAAVALLMLWWCTSRGIGTAIREGDEEARNVSVKRDILCLMMAYPEYIVEIEREEEGVFLVMKSGRRILYDDKKPKSCDEKLKSPDLQDTMEEVYPLGGKIAIMPENFDPGRIRHYGLLREVYGGSKSQVESNLVGVRIGLRSWAFNSSAKAAYFLQRAAGELETLSQSSGRARSYIFPINGTYNYRVVAGTSRLSPHAFGIALDLSVHKSDYWRWASREEGQKRLQEYPLKIVEAFEKNNFIWGGRWASFDIMHYEYRPEIILKAKYSQSKTGDWSPWYEGFPMDDEKVKEYIYIIDEALGRL